MKNTVTPAQIDALQRLDGDKRALRRALVGLRLQTKSLLAKSGAMILAEREADKIIKDTEVR